MHLLSIRPSFSVSMRRLWAAFSAVRTRNHHGLARALVDEYRRAAAATQRYEELASQRATRTERGVVRAAIARQVFNEYYASRYARDAEKPTAD